MCNKNKTPLGLCCIYEPLVGKLEPSAHINLEAITD